VHHDVRASYGVPAGQEGSGSEGDGDSSGSDGSGGAGETDGDGEWDSGGSELPSELDEEFSTGTEGEVWDGACVYGVCCVFCVSGVGMGGEGRGHGCGV